MADDKDRAQEELSKLPIKPGEKFRHYKGDQYGEYEIVTLAIKEDTLEPLVIYRSLTHGTTWARTYQNWSEEVEVEGQRVKRFERTSSIATN